MIIYHDPDDGLYSARFADDHDDDEEDFLYELPYEVNGIPVPLLIIDVYAEGRSYRLSQKRAAELWPVLMRFAETGSIKENP